jgi:RimJ/RimL family protein N-acetyltransferase
MELVGKRICLRRLLVEDLPQMVIWNRDTEVQFFVDCDLPGNLADLKQWYHENVPDPNYRIFAIQTLEGQTIGDLELDHICWSKREAELRIRIGVKEYWDRGYGSEALRLILNSFFSNRNFQRIYLRVYRFNHRAIRCYTKIGFKQVGILTRHCSNNWKDIILMEISEEQFRRFQIQVAG